MVLINPETLVLDIKLVWSSIGKKGGVATGVLLNQDHE